MAWEGEDRRKFPRVMYPCMVRIKSSDKSCQDLLTHTENIGQGGICVILKQEIRLFTPVDVELDLLDMTDHLHTQGKVVWVVRRKSNEEPKPLFYSVGIEFTEISKQDHDHLWNILQQLIKNGTQFTKPYI